MPSARSLSLASCWLIAWILLAAVNAVFIVLLPGGLSAFRLQHHLLDAGQLLFVGALVASFASLFERRFPARRPLAWALALLGCLILGWLFARRDFAGFAEDRAGEPWATPLLGAMVFVLALLPLGAAWISLRLFARPRLRWFALLLAAGLGVANNLLLPADYRGLHLFCALAASALGANALAGAKLPERLSGRRLARVGAALPTVLLLAALPAVILQPSNRLRLELARIDGAVLVPVLARFSWGARRGTATVPAELAPWFSDRRDLPPIAASSPSLLPPDPIVILLGIDSLRADLLQRKDTRPKLPHLSQLAERSLYFTLARSPGSRTITTWASVFTGRYTTGLRWRGDGNRQSVGDDPTTRFPELLTAAGVTTVTFVSYSALGESGLARNFDEVTEIDPGEGQKYGLSSQTVGPMLERTARHKRGSLFMFAHWMDPHFPYDAAASTGPSFDRFMAEASLADSSLGELLSGLEAQHNLDRTVLIVVADHGEAFGQHETPYHTVTVYDELIRVPLLIAAPGIRAHAIRTPVSLMDLGPTLLDLFGQPTPASFLGESLVPFMRGQEPQLTRPIGAERSGTRALVLGNRKIIIDRDRGRDEIYDLRNDPQETANIADDLGAEGKNLIELVDLYFDTHALLGQ